MAVRCQLVDCRITAAAGPEARSTLAGMKGRRGRRRDSRGHRKDEEDVGGKHGKWDGVAYRSACYKYGTCLLPSCSLCPVTNKRAMQATITAASLCHPTSSLPSSSSPKLAACPCQDRPGRIIARSRLPNLDLSST